MPGLLTSWRAAVTREGSTLSLGLLRVVLPLVLWARWGAELLPQRHLSAEHLAVSASFFLTTTWMLLGWEGRVGAAACALVVDWMVFGLGRTTKPEWGHHHTTLLALIVTYVSLGENSRSLSLDRWFAVRAHATGGPVPAPQRAPVWPLTLVAVQVSSVYLWSAFDKLTQPGFRSGERLTQVFLDGWWSSDWRMPAWAQALAVGSAWAVIALEVVLPFGLWSRRARPLLAVVGLGMHALFYLLLPVATFSVTMAASYLAFFDPDAVEAAVHRLLGVVPAPAGPARDTR